MRHTRVFLVLMVSVMAGTLFTGMAAAGTSKAAGQVMAVAGPVTVARADVTPHQLKFRDNLFWRDVVEARKNGIARVLLGGKATVARMLMRPGDQVEVWTFNTVASVRGTDFIVETVERPVQAPAFGLLGVREVAHGVGDSAAASGETGVG